MKSNNDNDLDFEINLCFIDNIRENINKDENTKNVKVVSRVEDFSQYTVIEDGNILLSFSNS
jgi:hypothetical protein